MDFGHRPPVGLGLRSGQRLVDGAGVVQNSGGQRESAERCQHLGHGPVGMAVAGMVTLLVPMQGDRQVNAVLPRLRMKREAGYGQGGHGGEKGGTVRAEAVERPHQHIAGGPGRGVEV